MTPLAHPAAGRLDADEATSMALLNCAIREIGAPQHQTWEAGPHFVLRLPRIGVALRAGLARPAAAVAPRLRPPFEELRRPGTWQPVSWRRLADLIAGELELETGTPNPEFVAQVSASHAVMNAVTRARLHDTGAIANASVTPSTEHTDTATNAISHATRTNTRPTASAATPHIEHIDTATDTAPNTVTHATLNSTPPIANGVATLRTEVVGAVTSAVTDDTHTVMPGLAPVRAAGPFIASEQALTAGHRFHPAPKARGGEDWLRYAPEAGARFPLRWLAVREEAIAEEGDTSLLDRLGPPVRPGYRVLPAHPWQASLLAVDSPLIVDLGPHGPATAPTSSVRTVHVPGTPDAFLKFSLDVRITNCVRKNSWYELTGAVALTRALRPVFAALPCELLGEPGYRTVALADRRLYEGLAVIVRDGVGGLPGTPLLAAAIADPYARSAAAVANLLRDAPPGRLANWWDAYVQRVLPPVLHAYLVHGVVLEPHLQNVLVTVDGDGTPVRAVFRDLEGTKLLPGPWDGLLCGLPGPVARALTYGPEPGWRRVVYCLFVNHLAEVAAAVADLCPDLEPELWRTVRRHLTRVGDECGDGAGRLRALLAGVPLPAKANLRTRWAREADRHAMYVPVPNPIAGAAPDAP